MIETRGLTRRYGDVVALDRLDLSVDKGDIFAFIGPNGAGKSTTLRILATLLRPTNGQAYVCGYSVLGQARHIRRRIGYVPDFFGVYRDTTVAEYLEYFAALYRLEPRQRARTIGDVLALTDLSGKTHADVSSLSRGMQQRLGLARVLLHDPEVLLLDEPASGLDPRARVEIRALLHELRAMGKTIVISSHILVELAELCNKVGIIEQGRLVYSGPIDEVLARVRRRGVVQISTSPLDHLDRARAILEGRQAVKSVTRRADLLEVELATEDTDPTEVLQALLDAKVPVSLFRLEQVNLEDAFLQLTKGQVS